MAWGDIFHVPYVPAQVTPWSHLFEIWCVSNVQMVICNRMNHRQIDLRRLVFLHDFSLLNAVGKIFRVSWQNQRGCSSGVEHNLAKVGVEGSNLFNRSSLSQKTTAEILSEVSYLIKSGWRLCFCAARQLSSRNLQQSRYGHSEDAMATIRKQNGR